MFLELFQIINFNIQYLQSISSARRCLMVSLPVSTVKGYLSSNEVVTAGAKKKTKTKPNQIEKTDKSTCP